MIDSMANIDVRDFGSEPKFNAQELEPVHKVVEKNGYNNDVKNIVPGIQDDIHGLRIRNIDEDITSLIEKVNSIDSKLDTLNEKLDEKRKIGFCDVIEFIVFVGVTVVGGSFAYKLMYH